MDRKTKDRKNGWTDEQIKNKKGERGGIEKAEGKGKEKENGGKEGRGGGHWERREAEKGAERLSYCVQVYNTAEGETAGNGRTSTPSTTCYPVIQLQESHDFCRKKWRLGLCIKKDKWKGRQKEVKTTINKGTHLKVKTAQRRCTWSAGCRLRRTFLTRSGRVRSERTRLWTVSAVKWGAVTGREWHLRSLKVSE